MPTRNVSLTGKLDRFVAKNVESGRYENASQVIRVALRSPNAKSANMKQNWLPGLRGDVFARVRKELGINRR